MKKTILRVLVALLIISANGYASDLPDESIYNLDQQWTNQKGEQQSLDSLQGQVRIVAMIYTHCGGACPLIAQTMKKIEKRLPESEATKVGFVLFSIDPKRDSPEMLRAFAKAQGLERDNWLLLTGSANDTQVLATALDFNFKEAKKGMFIHQNTIFVLDEKGVLVDQYLKLDEAVEGVIQALTKTSNDEVILPVSKI